jgi:alkaline phosphatase
MVEASEVDWADHANDPAFLMSDLMQFDKAVTAALDFAKADGNTLVLALSDHNTGGMSIGNYATSGTYSQMKLEQVLDPIKKMRLSVYGLWKKVGDEKTVGKVKAVVKTYWGMDITDDEANAILAISERDKEDPYNGFGEILCPKYTAIGWSTHGHTGGDVPLYAFGPGSPKGLQDGPEIGKVTASALQVNLDNLNRRLFVDAGEAFGRENVTIDKTDPLNLKVRVDFAGQRAELPVNKNIIILNGTEAELEGAVVYIANTDKAFIPMQAVNLIKGTDETLPVI